MPMYDYRCERCGDFREMRPMMESRSPRTCPSCGEAAERAICAPFLAGVDPQGRSESRHLGNGRVPWRTACGLGCSHVH
jgi:putative FmdB family regulatory protein